MAAQLVGAQLSTYNPNLPFTETTTAGTAGLILYGVSAAGAQAGITNTAVNTSNTAATGVYYTGITHFNNVAGNNGIFMGPAGAEIPLIDKQCAQTWTMASTSAAATGWVVAPFASTISGYWTATSAAATAANGGITVAIGSAGSTLLTLSATALSIGDTVAFSQGTAGNTIVPGGTALSINVATNGTAYSAVATIVMTRVGI